MYTIRSGLPVQIFRDKYSKQNVCLLIIFIKCCCFLHPQNIYHTHQNHLSMVILLSIISHMFLTAKTFLLGKTHFYHIYPKFSNTFSPYNICPKI